MLAGERMVADDGYEVMLFPFEVMYISQGVHDGFCLDFIGWNATTNIRIYKCPYYAPCSCTCVAKGSGGDWVVFNSDDKVWCADGTLRYVNWQQGHDDTPCNVGDHFNQGDLIGHTGTTGRVRGDHLHFNTAVGHYMGWTDHHLVASIDIWECGYVDDTVMYRPRTYNWITYGGTPGPGPGPVIKIEKKNFPWFIISHQRMRK